MTAKLTSLFWCYVRVLYYQVGAYSTDKQRNQPHWECSAKSLDQREHHERGKAFLLGTKSTITVSSPQHQGQKGSMRGQQAIREKMDKIYAILRYFILQCIFLWNNSNNVDLRSCSLYALWSERTKSGHTYSTDSESQNFFRTIKYIQCLKLHLNS